MSKRHIQREVAALIITLYLLMGVVGMAPRVARTLQVDGDLVALSYGESAGILSRMSTREELTRETEYFLELEAADNPDIAALLRRNSVDGTLDTKSNGVDAIRHAYSSAVIGYEVARSLTESGLTFNLNYGLGQDIACKAGEFVSHALGYGVELARDQDDLPQTAADRHMDLHNNYQGRLLCTDIPLDASDYKEQIAERVIALWRDGTLITNPLDEQNPYHQDVVAYLLDGASEAYGRLNGRDMRFLRECPNGMQTCDKGFIELHDYVQLALMLWMTVMLARVAPMHLDAVLGDLGLKNPDSIER